MEHRKEPRKEPDRDTVSLVLQVTGLGTIARVDRQILRKFLSSRVKTKRDVDSLIELFRHRGRCSLYPAIFGFYGIE